MILIYMLYVKTQNKNHGKTGGGSGGKMLALQAWGLELRSPIPT